MKSRIFKRHDTAGTPWARLLDESGTPINLTGCEVVYTLQNSITTVNKIARATAVVRDQGLYPGEVLFHFVPADTDTEGSYSEEWEVTYPGGTKESFPVGERIEVSIQADLDAV